jgi:hypothetical protein
MTINLISNTVINKDSESSNSLGVSVKEHRDPHGFSHLTEAGEYVCLCHDKFPSPGMLANHVRRFTDVPHPKLIDEDPEREEPMMWSY